MKVQNSFLPKEKYNSMRTCSTKILSIVEYPCIKSCVKYKECQSDFFPCLTGVRQGGYLHPFLFSVFLNDLEDYFKTLDGVPLEKLKNVL
jgi:hypothetical protein